jgi:acyl-CoA synthetase (AMP-forming)/AMP-acid ligase II/acyl carrier protein
MLGSPQKTLAGMRASSSDLNDLVARLASSVLQAPVAADQTLVAQGLDSLGAVDLLEALEENGYRADYEHILAGATVSSLAESLRRTGSDGPRPAPAERAAGPVPLTGPQAIWADLERAGWGSWANISLCLSMPASVISAGFLPAIAQSLCDANEAMRLVLVDAPEGGAVLQKAIPAFQLPIQFAAAPASERDAMRLVEAFEGEETSPFAPSTRALILASPGRDGRHWLCISMHHAFADRIAMQSLAHQVRTMIGRGDFRATQQAIVGFLDHAMRQNEASDPDEAAESELRALLAGADVSMARPIPHLADADALDLGERPASASTLRAAECDALEALATSLETTLPLLLHALFSVLVARLVGDGKAASGEADMLLCHVVSNRERGAYLKSLVGCLDTSIPVAVRLGEEETVRSLCLRTRQVFAAAHRAASGLPRGRWLDGEAPALFERVPHINIVRAPAGEPAEGDLADIREHPVRRPQKTRWGLLLRVALPPSDGGGPRGTGQSDRDGMRVSAYAEHRPLASAAEYCLIALLRDLLGQPAERVGDLPILERVDRAIGRARFAAAQLRRATALGPRSTGGQAFIYDKLVARQRRWYAHDERYELRRDDSNRFVGTAANPFPFTQLDKLRERRFLEDLGIPLPKLLHVLPKEGLREALGTLAPGLPDNFVIKPVGAGHSFGVTIVRDGIDLTRNGAPFDAGVVAEELSQMADRGSCRHEGHVFPFNFSSFLIEELVEDEAGFAAATDYKLFHIGEKLLWIQIHFREGGHAWVAFVDAHFNLLSQPAWDPTTCWRTHGVLVCTDQAMVSARRPACLPEMLEQSRHLAGHMGIFVRLDWYADRSRGPLMGEITLFPHMLQPRSFYSSWANGAVADAWQDPDGVAAPVDASPAAGAIEPSGRVEAILDGEASGGFSLEDVLPPPSHADWALGDAVTFEALRASIARFDLAPWAVAGGDRVALFVGNGVQLASLLLATMNRYVAVPIGSALPANMLLAHLKEGAVGTLLVVAGTEEAQKARAVARQLPGLVVVELVRDGPAGLAALPARPAFRAVQAPTPRRGPADDVLILRTSGSTGAPKSVCFTLAGLVRSGSIIGRSLRLSAADLGISMLPLNHVGGIACNLVAPMLAGAPMRFFKAFDPKAFFDALAGGQGASWCYLVPTMWDMVLDYARSHPELRRTRPWPRLRVLRSAGADLPHDTARALADLFGDAVSIVPTYGMTEAMPIAAPPLPYRLERPGSVGRVLPTVEVEIVDASGTGQMAPVPDGIVGEVTVRGPTVARRVDQAGAGSSDDVTPRGYFRTGDLGRLAADGSGWLSISGRIKDAINRGGETIAPGEVEAMLRRYPGWSDAADAVHLMAFARAHRELGEDVALAVAPLSARVDLAHLNAWADGHLPAAMQPKTLVLCPRLPLSDTGKLLRARFAERFNASAPPGELGVLHTYVIDGDDPDPRLEQEVRAAQVPADHVRTEPAVTLAAIIDIVRSLAPGGTEVDPDSRLDDVGINSLGAIELSARLNERFGSRLPTWAASDHPTPRALYDQIVGTSAALRIDEAEGGAPPAAKAIPSPARTATGPLRMLFLHGEGGDSDLMELSLLATQWMGRLETRMQFLFLDAPHRCAPKPEFHAAAVEAGLYGKAEYRSWGAATEEGLAESVAAVLARLDDLAPVDAIGGICDGGLVAALVAARRPDIRLYLNISSSPLSRFPDAVAEADWQIACPSVHLISPRDEFHTFQEQLGIPQRCEKALLLQHDRGHAVPTLDERLKREMLSILDGIADTAQTTPEPGSRPFVSTAASAPDGSSAADGQQPSDETLPPVRFPAETLREIEALIAGHESIESVAVLDLPQAGHRRLHAFVVLDQYAAARTSDLGASLRSRLPVHWMPERFVPIDALPRTADGRLDSGALIGRLPKAGGASSRPRTPLERDLAAIWRDVLMIDFDPGIDDDFFDLGGYSLLSVVLIRAIEARLGRPLPRKALLHLGTIRRLAAILYEVDGAEPADDLPPADTADGLDDMPALDPDIHAGLLGHIAGWRGARSRPDSLVFGKNTDGSATPIFWCFQGYAEFSELARFLGPDQPLYGMRSGHLVMENTPQNVDMMAACYAAEILDIGVDGPVVVGGHCQAARIAFQIARRLQEHGRPVSLLCLQEQTVPMAYSGRVALFLGEGSLVSPTHYFEDVDRCWRPFFSGPVSVNAITGEDGRFFKQPNIKPLAAMIRAEVARAASAGEAGRTMSAVPKPILAASAHRATIRAPEHLSVRDGQRVAQIDVEVTNAGDTTWPCDVEDGIAIGYWLCAEGVEPPVFYGLGARLPADLAPGARVTIPLEIAIPRKPGLYRIEVDLVDNKAAWFRFGGSPVAAIDLDTRPGLPPKPPAPRGLLARLFGRSR